MLPAVTVCDDGVAEIVKSGTGLMMRVTVVLWDSAPSVPVIVRILVPAGVDDVVAIVRVELPAPAIEAGLKEADAPAGNPLTLQLTVSLKPLMAVTVAV